MKSLDTNILIYAANKNCLEHVRAFAIVEQLLKKPAEWILSDQVMFEYMRALTNRAIFSSPITKEKAAQTVNEFRNNCGAAFCAYTGEIFEEVVRLHRKSRVDRLYDIILAATLKYFGVTEFFTRNTKDFQGLGIDKVVNPIDVG